MEKQFTRLLIVIILLSISYFSALSQNRYLNDNESSKVVDRILSEMTPREKLAQLFIVSFSSDTGDINTLKAISEIKKERVGGVILMNSPLTPAVNMINYLQSISKIPLLVTIDGEWGAAMRFDSIVPFPRQMQLGALSDDSLVYKMGYAIGKQARRVGVDVNFAPTIDINNNPRNPVINTRSFGENPLLVTKYGVAYMNGMKDAGVPGSAKHFPGHGDTDVDSHKSLPLISFSKKRIDSLELMPFRTLIESGVDMIMVGHLQIPSLDSTGKPASISREIIGNLLRRDLEYNGLIVTDALNMKGVSDHYPAEILPLEAFKAGCDIILMPEKVSEALNVMERALQTGEISMHSVNLRCQKILDLKLKLGIVESRPPVNKENLYRDLNNSDYISLISVISKESLTLIKNDESFLPYKNLKSEKIGYLSLGGDANGKELARFLSFYADIDTLILRGKYKLSHVSAALNSLSANKSFIIAMHNTDSRPQRDFGLNENEIKLLTNFATKRDVTFVYFGNPLAIPFIKGLDKFRSVIIAYNNNIFNNIAAGEIILGVSGAQGRLPVTSGSYPLGFGLKSNGNLRVKYDAVEFAGFNFCSEYDSIDSLVNKDIDDGLYGGAQLIAVYKNRVIINRSYGNLTHMTPVALNRISPLVCELPAISELFASEKISPEDFAGKHIKFKKGSKMGNVLISDILMHRTSPEIEKREFPVYSSDNVEYLRKIIGRVTNRDLPEYIKDTIFSVIGMNNTSISKNIVYTNANDLVKFLTMINKGGFYGGVKVMSDSAAFFTELFDQYYFSSLNGSMVWKDPSNDFILIFLNNGEESSLKETNLPYTGDSIRRRVENIVNGGN